MGERKSVPVLFVKGTHYDVGLQVGTEFRSRIQEYLSSHPYKDTLLSYYKEKDGKHFLDSLLSTCRAKYPHYCEEIKGLATGAQVPLQELELLHLELEFRTHLGLFNDRPTSLKVFDETHNEDGEDFEERLNEWDMSGSAAAGTTTPPNERALYKDLEELEEMFKEFDNLGCTDLLLNVPGKQLELLHLEKEVMTAIGENPRAPDRLLQEAHTLGCTDLVLNTGQQMIIGHNMDFYNKMADTLYVVCAHILPYKSRAGREFPEEKFVSMQYTGFLFGGNCSFNQHGLVYALGATYPRDTGPGRIPELFLRRHFLSATSPSDALRILENNGGGCATGFAIHFGFLSQPKTLWSAEVGPCTEEKKSELSVLTVSPDVGRHFYAHTNHYQHLSISHYISASSTARRTKVDELPVPESMDDIRAILGNNESETYPIFLSTTTSVKKKQTSSCVYTGIFDLLARKFYLYLDNPATGGPVLTLGLDMFN